MNNAINQCTVLLDEKTRRYLKTINAKVPKFTGLPKLHKESTPNRPVINYTTAPGYKATKLLETIIKNNIRIKNNYSIKNSYEFFEKLKKMKMIPQYKFVSFDITNLYTNVPVKETIEILTNNLNEVAQLGTQEINELIKLLTVVLEQNYFTFDNDFFIQNDGLAMGSPLSGLLADIYLNYFENANIIDNRLYKDKIIFYCRYVDDTFMVFNGTRRQIENLNSHLNSIHQKIKFTSEIEAENQLNFLDLTVTKNAGQLQFKIFRKATTTDITIHADSYHPVSQKMAAYNSFVHRLLTIPLSKNDYNEEVDTIKYIAAANGYKSSLIDKLINKHRKKKVKKLASDDLLLVKKYISADYTNILPNIIKNEFKIHQVHVTFHTKNSIQKFLSQKSTVPNKERTGVYKMTCSSCDMFYLGQTGRPFEECYKEHQGGSRRDLQKTTSNFPDT